MVTLVWRTDVHLADKGPSSRLDGDRWPEVVSDKLLQVADVARREDAMAVIDGGDFFDKKSPSRNSHRLVRQAADIHEQYPCPVYACVGNHDCVHGNIEYLPQQPLGVLFSTGVFRRLYDEHEAFFERGGVTVRVVGVPYHGYRYDLDRLAVPKGDEDYLVVVAHLLASEKGGSMFEGEDIVPYKRLRGMPADLMAFGHWHKDQGVTDLAGTKIVNIGSLTRGSLSEDNIERTPSCAVWRFRPGGIEVEKVGMKIAHFSETFDIEGRAKKESRELLNKAFTDKVAEMFADNDNRANLRDVIRSKRGELPERVVELADQFLEEAGG